MKKIVFFVIFSVLGCVSVNRFDNLEDRVDRLRKELNHTQNHLSLALLNHQAAEKMEKLAKLEAENNHSEKLLSYLDQLIFEGKRHLKLIGQLQDENVKRFAETAQVRKDLADVCARLRKYHRIPDDHVCSFKKTKKLQSNPKTENEIILEEFNKKVKQINQRRKK